MPVLQAAVVTRASSTDAATCAPLLNTIGALSYAALQPAASTLAIPSAPVTDVDAATANTKGTWSL
jgi:hypothetical protein